MLQDGTGEDLIFLGDNDNYKAGDVVEVMPMHSGLSHKDSNMDGRSQKRSTIDTSVDKNAPTYHMRDSAHKISSALTKSKSSGKVSSAGGANENQDLCVRNSLVVTLNKGFYKPNQQTKKLFVSIEQGLAELHGFRKDMTIKVKKIEREEISKFSTQHLKPEVLATNAAYNSFPYY